MKVSVIESISSLLIDHYIDRKVANKIADEINQKLKHGKYDQCAKYSSFGEAISQDVRNCSGDYHFLVYYDQQKSNELIQLDKDEQYHEKYEDDWWSNLKFYNYGIQKLEYLQGNVGYINIQCFAPAPMAGDAVVSAMTFLSGSDALIIDLRECVGGDPFTVQFLESYLFDQRKRPKLMLTRYTRDEIPEHQEWTYPYVPGKRLPDIPVYVLTSASTFSGGEDMAYSLKHHGRAIIVGEQTGGGAHGVKWMGTPEGFVIVLPNSYSKNPVTQTDWEGVGVEPDVKVAGDKALSIAHTLAMESLIGMSVSQDQKHRLAWSLDRIKAEYHPHIMSVKQLRKYTGHYRGWAITYKDGFLHLSQKGGIGLSKMLPISETVFTGDAEYNIRFELEENGNAKAITWLARDDERVIVYEKD
jgi:hypothetical protein